MNNNKNNQGWVEGLSRNQTVMNFGAFMVAGVFALACGIIAWRFGKAQLPYILWSGTMA